MYIDMVGYHAIIFLTVQVGQASIEDVLVAQMESNVDEGQSVILSTYM